MSSSGPRYPVTISESGVTPYDDNAWGGSVTDIGADNNTYATIDSPTFDSPDYSNQIFATNFGFTIPDGSTINGITVTVGRFYANGTVVDALCQLTKDGTTGVGDNKSAGATWASSEEAKGFGSTSDLWNTTWTAAEVNASTFGVLFACQASGANADAYIDYIRVTIEYTAGAPTLVVADAYSINAADTPTLTQVHNIIVPDAYSENAADVFALTQIHNIVVADAATEQAADAPTLTVDYNLGIQDAYSDQVADAPTLTQVHNLSVADAYNNQVADNITFPGGVITLTVADAYNDQVADAPVVTKNSLIDLGSLYEQITRLLPIIYWQMGETSGTSAINYGSLGTDANGTYTGVTLNSIDAPGGTRSPLFDGVDDVLKIYTTALANAFDADKVTILAWYKVHDLGCWSDSVSRDIVSITNYPASPRYYVHFGKAGASDNMTFQYYANDSLRSSNIAITPNTEWNLITFTNDYAADDLKVYINDTNKIDSDSPNEWDVSGLYSNNTSIGAWRNIPTMTYLWYGYISHVAIYDKVLTADEISAVYTAGTGTGGGRENYTAHAVDTVTLTQVHHLAVQDCSTEHVVDTPTISEVTGSLTIQDAYSEQVADTFAITQVHVLSVNDSYSADVADTFAITQVHVLTVTDGYTETYSDTFALTQAHVITIADAYTEQIADAVVLIGGGVTELEIDDAYSATYADTMTLYWGLVALTLQTRATTLTLETRDDDLSLRSRATTLTLEDVR